MSTFAVIGLGQLGRSVALYLAEQDQDVVAIDSDMNRVEAIKDRVTAAKCLDTTDERALRGAGLQEAQTVVLALGEDQLEAAALTTIHLRELGVGQIISRAATDLQAKVLRRVGVSQVLFPERDVGRQLARRLLMPRVQTLLPLEHGLAVAEVKIPKQWHQKTILETRIRARFSVHIVAFKEALPSSDDDGDIDYHWSVNTNPGPDTVLMAEGHMVVIGHETSIATLLAEIFNGASAS